MNYDKWQIKILKTFTLSAVKHSRHKLRRIIYADIDRVRPQPPAKQHGAVLLMVLPSIIVWKHSVVRIENSAHKRKPYYTSVDMP